jgi:hypothetical protein
MTRGDPGVQGRLGIGTYAGDEILLVRRPTGGDVSLEGILGPAATNHLLFGIDDASAKSFRPDSTPPYRFRNYLGFWDVGPVPHPEFARQVLSYVPDYLVRDVRGDSAGELLFLLFLSNLHDMGRLDARSVPVEVMLDAMRSTLRLFPALVSSGTGKNVPEVAGCITNGQHLVAAASGTDLWLEFLDELPDCERCSDSTRTVDHDPRQARHKVRVVTLAHLRQDTPPEGAFKAVSDGEVVAVRDDGVLVSIAAEPPKTAV